MALAWSKTTRYSLRDLSRQTLSHETARQLILDTSLRLEGQTYFLKQLEDQLQSPEVSTRRDTSNQVIRATNSSLTFNLLDWRGHLEREREKHQSFQQARQLLQNLLYLHHDTHKLTQQLLNSKRIFGNHSRISPTQEEPTTRLSVAIMEQIRSRHATSLETMADIVLLLRKQQQQHHEQEQEHPTKDNDFFSSWSYNPNVVNFLRGRLSVQILCDHYVNLYTKQPQSQQQSQQYVRHGAVHLNCPLEPILQEAWTEAKHLCEAHYQISPNVQYCLSHPISNITCIRPWLQYCLVEIFKNSMVASLDMIHDTLFWHKGESNEFIPPPIVISVDEVIRHDENPPSSWICLKIEDSGSGLTNKNPFMFASNSKKWDRLHIQQSYASVRSPLSSMGVGVPSSQWLLQHWGGYLELSQRKDGNGCTATIWLPKNDEIREYLPLVG
jgi:pyruvate dehydrogenase kinase 2/3/4